MGLDVGIVTITYLDSPESPVTEFLLHLASDVSIGYDDEEYEADTHYDEPYKWGGGWAENTLVEFSRPYLNWKADQWVGSQGIGVEERDAVQSWIGDLPWKNDMIMLHLGV